MADKPVTLLYLTDEGVRDSGGNKREKDLEGKVPILFNTFISPEAKTIEEFARSSGFELEYALLLLPETKHFSTHRHRDNVHTEEGDAASEPTRQEDTLTLVTVNYYGYK